MTQKLPCRGADIVFEEVAPGEYTVKVEAWDTGDALLARKSASVKVKAGETSDCSIALILLADSALETQYLLWTCDSSSYGMAQIESLTSGIAIDPGTDEGPSFFGMAEDLPGNFYYTTTSPSKIQYNDSSTLSIVFNRTITDEDVFSDPLYYDESTKTLYFFAHNGGILSYAAFVEPHKNGSPLISDDADGDANFEGDTGEAFAIRGNVLYLAYTKDGTSYLQRATIDLFYGISMVGSAKSVEQMGFSGVITDIAILYDDTVYVLVSNVGNAASDNTSEILYDAGTGGTFYSRGALLKIETTSSGFEVVDSLGWTENARSISPVGEVFYNSTSTVLQPQTAYIPPFAKKSSMFYGPRRFAAIKPKEIAIADSGYNMVMPDAEEKKNGCFFTHDRVMTVNLRDFVISSEVEMENIKFTELNFSGTSDGYTIQGYYDDGAPFSGGTVDEQ